MIAQGYIAAAIAAASFAAGGTIAWKYQGARLETCATQRTSLANSVEAQNASIKAMADQGAKDRATLAEALKSGQEARQKASAMVAARNLKKAPDSCDEAIRMTDAE